MSYDWLVTSRLDVDPALLILAIDDATGQRGDGWSVHADPDGRVVVVVDGSGRPVAWVGPTRLVHDPAGAARRLAMGTVPDQECYWTEVTTRREGDLPVVAAVVEQLARDGQGRSVELAGVAASHPRGHDDPGGARPSGMARSGRAQEDPGEAPVDVVGAEEAVLVQRRPVVGLGPWLTHALLWAGQGSRRLVLLTPPTSRLTPAVERLVHHGGLRWVVDDGRRSVEVHRGQVVRWDGARFVADPQAAAGRWPTDPDAAWTLLVEAEAITPYPQPDAGSLTEAVARALDLGMPSGAGLMEPVESSWDRAAVTELARRQSPIAAQVVVTGARFDGVLSVVPQPGGVLERVELVVDAPAEPHGPAALAQLGDRLARTGAQLAVLGYRWGTTCRVVPPSGVGPLLPGLLVAQPPRFPGLTAEALGAAGGHGKPEQSDTGAWVLTFPAAPGLDPAESRAILRRWREALRLLQVHDTVARAVATQAVG